MYVCECAWVCLRVYVRLRVCVLVVHGRFEQVCYDVYQKLQKRTMAELIIDTRKHFKRMWILINLHVIVYV